MKQQLIFKSLYWSVFSIILHKIFLPVPSISTPYIIKIVCVSLSPVPPIYIYNTVKCSNILYYVRLIRNQFRWIVLAEKWDIRLLDATYIWKLRYRWMAECLSKTCQALRLIATSIILNVWKQHYQKVYGAGWGQERFKQNIEFYKHWRCISLILGGFSDTKMGPSSDMFCSHILNWKYYSWHHFMKQWFNKKKR